MKLGDAIATVATPIARALKMDCIDPATQQLRPESGCSKMRNNLNAGMSLSNAIAIRWFNNKQRGEKMTFIMQIKIDAGKISEAVAKMEAVDGVEVIGINPAPPQMQTPKKSQ